MCVIGIVGIVGGGMVVGGVIIEATERYSDHSDHHDYSNHSDYSDAVERQRRREESLRQEIKNLQVQLAQDVVGELTMFQNQNSLPPRFSLEANELATVIKQGKVFFQLQEPQQSLIRIIEGHYKDKLELELSEKRKQLEIVDALIKRVNEIRLET